MTLTFYADFACAECYVASRRVDLLAAVGVEVDWRAVELHPRLPVTGHRFDAEEHAALAEQLTELKATLLPGEDPPWRTPDLAPKTEAAVSGYAEAYGAGVAADVRRLLFAAYWVDGANIGDPEVLRARLAGPILRGHSIAVPLRDFGYAVSVNRGPITTTAWHRIRAWRDEWSRLGPVTLPTLVEDGRLPVTGRAVLRHLEREIIARRVEFGLDLPDPARYPEMAVRPSREWVSQVGGPWSHAWRASR